MKKLFILAAAIVAFASCSKEQATYVEDGSIKFTTMETRTAVSDLSTLQGKGFSVLGYAGTAKIFNNEHATPSTDKTWWEMANKKYWADNTTYNFFAAYPESEFTANTGLTAATLNFKNDGETDLILAGTQIQTTTGANGAGRGAAHMTFKHALSRVAFKFVNAYESTGTVGEGGKANTITLKVEQLELVNQAGTADVTITSTVLGNKVDANSNTIPDLGSSASKITWGTLTKDATKPNISYMVGGEFAGANAIAQTASATTDYKYILPNTDNTDKTLQIKCKITALDSDNNVIREFNYTNDGTANDKGYITVTLKGGSSALTHNAGESYLYTMTVSETLNEITFTVDVEEWATDTTNDIEFPSNQTK